MMTETTTVWRRIFGSGVWLLLAGVMLQAVVWYFPVQRAMGGRTNSDSALLLGMHALAMVVPGLLAMAAMREPLRPVKGLWLVGWVLSTGGMAGMLGVLGILWVLQEAGRFEWAWGYSVMCWAGVIGAVWLGMFWKLLSGRGAWAMSMAGVVVSLVGLVGMYWFTRPYFYGVEHLYRAEVWGGGFSNRILALAVLAIVFLVLMARRVSRTGVGLQGGLPSEDGDLKQRLSTVYLKMALVAQLVGPLLCVMGIIVLEIFGGAPRFMAFVMLGFVAAQPVTGAWLMRWAYRNRVELMPDGLHAVLLWRYLWLGLLGAAVVGGILLMMLMAFFERNGVIREIIPVFCFGVSVVMAVMYPILWRRLKGQPIFESLWLIAWGETVVGLFVTASAGNAYLLSEAIIFLGVGLVMVLPGVVMLGVRASIEHERDVIEGRLRGVCLGCGYDLTGTLAAGRSECPECGKRMGMAAVVER